MGAGRVGPVVFVLVRSCGRVVLLVSWLTSYAGQDPGRGREGAAVSSPSGLARDGVGFVSTPANVRATELQTSGGEKGEAGRRARVRRGAGSGSGTWDVLGAGGKPKTDPQSSSRQATGNRAKQTPSEYYFRNRPPTFRWLLALCAGCERERQKDIDMRKRESGGRRSKSYKGRSVGGRSVLVLTLDWAISWRPPLEDVETPGTQHPSTVQVATGGSCWVLTGDVISLVVARYRRNSLAKGGREGGGRDVRGDRPCKSALAGKKPLPFTALFINLRFLRACPVQIHRSTASMDPSISTSLGPAVKGGGIPGWMEESRACPGPASPLLPCT